MSAGIQAPAEFARMIAMAQAAGHRHIIELLRPAMRGELNLAFPQRDTRMPPLHRLEKKGRPVAVIVGEDDYRPGGPAAWACAEKLRSWARYAIVHGAAADPMHYAAAAAMTIQARRLLLIETTSDTAQAWAEFLQCRTPVLPVLGILPSCGPHPVLPARGKVH